MSASSSVARLDMPRREPLQPAHVASDADGTLRATGSRDAAELASTEANALELDRRGGLPAGGE
jgi:hypothetical protein